MTTVYLTRPTPCTTPAPALGLHEIRDAAQDALRSGSLTWEERNELQHALAQYDFVTRPGLGAPVDPWEAQAAADRLRAALAAIEAGGAGAITGPSVPAASAPSDQIGAGAAGGYAHDFVRDHITNGKALLGMYETDPEAFAAQWRSLSGEDRQMAMMSLQQAQNIEAQITSMFSNLMKANHDTVMAVARNLQA